MTGLGLLRCFLLWMVSKLTSGMNFEILQAYLHRLLAVYAELILKQPVLSKELEMVRSVHAASSNRFRHLVQSNLCLLKMFAGLPPT
jgi:Utp21 specific WD40 associated putative domain